MSDNIQRETMDVDVLFVGAGVASLSGAIHLSKLIEKHNADVASGAKQGTKLEPVISVLEKASEVGAHSMSGAVLNPIALKELMPDFAEKGCPIESPVVEDAVYFLTSTCSTRFPITPPPFKNHGNLIISISKFNRWLGKMAESMGVNIFAGFAGSDVLYDGDKVVGIQTGDKGRGKDGNPRSNFEPGIILKSKVTVFGEGTRGSLFKKVAKKLNLKEGKAPDIFEEGVKEIVQMPPGTVKPDRVIHTMGFPLKKSIGGTFIYTLPNDQISIGLVGYLDTSDPFFDPHRELQRFKTHPFVQDLLKGGKVIAYGGKTLPAGGWYSMPRLSHNGMMVIGDSASMVDVKRLKGIHMAMKSGMCAAEAIYESLLANDFGAEKLKRYDQLIGESFISKELKETRNFHSTLSMGLFTSMPFLAVQELLGGASLLPSKASGHHDSETTKSVSEVWGQKKLDEAEELSLPKPDGVLFFDKLSSVYLTGTSHDEHSPNHLILGNPSVCQNECYPKFQSPCVRFCPAAVYEMIPDASSGKRKLQINYTNCIHCKTCDIKCPHENIDWTVPEGGGGPKYTQT